MNLFVMNNIGKNFIKIKLSEAQVKNGKNSIEGKYFDLPHPAFGRSRKQKEVNNKIVLE